MHSPRQTRHQVLFHPPPKLLLIDSQIDSLSSRNLLTKTDLVTLIEALCVCIQSNEIDHIGNYKREDGFIKKISA